MLNKADRFRSVSAALFEIAASRGFGAVSVSRVSAEAGVSRAWIYKYYGKSTTTLIRTATDHFREELLALRVPADSFEDQEAWLQHLIDGTYEVLNYFQSNPSVFRIYLQAFDAKNPIRKHVDEFEAQQIAQLSRGIRRFYDAKPTRASASARVVFAIRIGLCHQFLQERLPEAEFRDIMRGIFRESLRKL